MLAIGFVIAITLLAGAVVSLSRLPRGVKLLVYTALALRYLGAFARQAIAADARIYFWWGERYAEYFSRLDFSPLFDPLLWRGASWTGTNFMGYPPGFVITLIGPSWLGTFFAFGLLSFVGLAAYALAYRRSFPGVPYIAYWAWIFLLPSLWFWPSSIGKESMMLIGLGIATLGFAGKRGRPNWLVVGAGLALVFFIRPQVAAVFLFAVTLSYWLHFNTWSPGKVLQGIVILAVGLAAVWFTMAATLGGEVDLASVEGYVDRNAGLNTYGGSSVEGVGASPAGIPFAVMNVLFRPFIWEAHSVAALVSALEVLLIWGLAWFRRKELRAALKVWRRDRMLRFAIPFVVLYVVALGMNLSNLGLIARQRVLVFPLLFMIVEAGVFYRRQQMIPARPLSRRARRRPEVPT